MKITFRNRSWRRAGMMHCVLAVLLLLSACRENLSETSPAITPSAALPVKTQTVRPPTVDGLQAFYQALDYDWERLDEGVPPFVLRHFPDDLDALHDIRERKQLFFMGLLPMVLMINQEIRDERQHLLDLLDLIKQDVELTSEQATWLRQLAEKYGLRRDPVTDHRARSVLLRRVDVLPPSLVLAQAANESAWGTSRFAREGNNLFGQWTFTPGTGIVPQGRPPGATYEVRRFRSLLASVRGYFTNLNTHSAYLELRKIRQRLRRQGEEVSGRALAEGLTRYSSRGTDYIHEIKTMIRHNGLERLNRVALHVPQRDATEAVGPSGSGLLSSRYQINRLDVARVDPPRAD